MPLFVFVKKRHDLAVGAVGLINVYLLALIEVARAGYRLV
jgi:hypothetical protein